MSELSVLVLQLPDPVDVPCEPVVEVLEAHLLLLPGEPGALGHVGVRVVVQAQLVQGVGGLVAARLAGAGPAHRLHDAGDVLRRLLRLL